MESPLMRNTSHRWLLNRSPASVGDITSPRFAQRYCSEYDLSRSSVTVRSAVSALYAGFSMFWHSEPKNNSPMLIHDIGMSAQVTKATVDRISSMTMVCFLSLLSDILPPRYTAGAIPTIAAASSTETPFALTPIFWLSMRVIIGHTIEPSPVTRRPKASM